MAKESDDITISRAELDRRINEAATIAANAAAAAMSAQSVMHTQTEVARLMTAKTPDEVFAERMAAARGAAKPPSTTREFRVPCRSPLTDATFFARLVRSKAFPTGRIVELQEYERPVGWNVHREDGGLCPLDRSLMGLDPQGNHHWAFRKWVYETFWQTDLEALVGKGGIAYLKSWTVGEEVPFIDEDTTAEKPAAE